MMISNAAIRCMPSLTAYPMPTTPLSVLSFLYVHQILLKRNIVLTARQHLNKIQEHYTENRMNAGNLAICFGYALPQIYYTLESRANYVPDQP